MKAFGILKPGPWGEISKIIIAEGLSSLAKGHELNIQGPQFKHCGHVYVAFNKTSRQPTGACSTLGETFIAAHDNCIIVNLPYRTMTAPEQKTARTTWIPIQDYIAQRNLTPKAA